MITWKIHRFDSVSSTMDVARDLLSADAIPPYAVLAKQQEKGMGRHQRSWSSPSGNFYATLVVPVEDLLKAPFFSYVAALAVHGAVEHLTKAHKALTLKWPNDLLLDSKKVGGILLEVETTPEGLRLLIGVGLNLELHPSDTPYGASNLAAHGFHVTVEALLTRLCINFDHWRSIFEKEGFPPLRQEWLRLRDPAHTQLTLKGYEHRSKVPITGSFQDLDEDGCLVLACEENGEKVFKRFSAGDVFFS